MQAEPLQHACPHRAIICIALTSEGCPQAGIRLLTDQMQDLMHDCRPAGYHDDALYPVLEPAIRPLVALLADHEDKTRSNAAGALGNLVRNSNQLCGAMLRAGALQVTHLGSRNDATCGRTAVQCLCII